jgi:5'-nucleotidase
VRILVTNDDGIEAPGVRAMASALAMRHQVWLVAPERERSASGHSITLHRPLHAMPREVTSDIRAWAVSGTPVDCVKLAVQGLMDQPPDLVVSGVNHGSNLGRDIFYSGTVSAAIEAHFLGLSALAVSQADPTDEDVTRAAATVADWVAHGIAGGMPGLLLNINFPRWGDMPSGPRPVAARLGRREYAHEFERRLDPRGHEYYWLAGQVQEDCQPEDTDVGAIQRGLVPVTPLRLEASNLERLPALAEVLQRLPPQSNQPPERL